MFKEEIDTDKEYTLKEMKEILVNIYKKNTAKPIKLIKQIKPVKDTKSDDDDDVVVPKKRGRPAKVKLDKDGNIKEKRAPSAYNNYVGMYIKENKGDNLDKTAKELMGVAAKVWKIMSDDEKAKYK